MNIDLPPEARPLPNHERHRQDLLAAIRAESQAGFAAGTARRRPPWLTRAWAGPAAAAAAVLVVVATAITVPGLLRHGHGTPGTGRTQRAVPAAAGTGAAGTVPVTSVPVTTVPVTTAPTRTAGGQWLVTSSFQVISPVTSVTVRDPVGSVTVTEGDTQNVSVTADIRATRGAPAVTRSLSGQALSLGYSSCTDCGVGFRITVPRDVNVQVIEGTGKVTLTGLSGNTDVRSDTGSVTATGLSGSDDQFRVGTGLIDAAFVTPPARVGAVASTGSVTIRVPSGATYQVSANAGLGSANVTVPQAAHSGHVITAQTGTGLVSVTS